MYSKNTLENLYIFVMTFLDFRCFCCIYILWFDAKDDGRRWNWSMKKNKNGFFNQSPRVLFIKMFLLHDYRDCDVSFS